MAQPPGFVDPRFPYHVCRLKKALYGLRQAPLAWFQRFSSYLTSLGFLQSHCGSSLFHFHRGTSIIYLLLYVDDIIVTGNDSSLLHNFISRTHREFAIKDLGRLNYFLGLEVSYTSDGLFVGQAKYARDILERAELLDSKPAPPRWQLENLLLVMVIPFVILRCTGLLLGLFSISPSLVMISRTPSVRLANFFNLRLMIIFWR